MINIMYMFTITKKTRGQCGWNRRSEGDNDRTWVLELEVRGQVMVIMATSAFTLSEVGERGGFGAGEGQDLPFGFCAGKRGRGQKCHVCLAHSKPLISVSVKDAC